MKYYVYISDAKIDMLLPQVPHEAKKKIATEFGVDLKIFKVGRKSEEEIEDNRITRLDAVVTFLREYGNLGSVEEPDEFFEGNQEMAMACDSEGVLFTSSSEELALCLAGSQRHLIGNYEAGDGNRMESNSMGIYRMLREYEKKGRIIESLAGATPEDSIRFLAMDFSRDTQFPKHRLEFIAKSLFQAHISVPGEFTGLVLLGTPLYVAMTG